MSEGTILIADDDRAIRTVLSQSLGREGYDVRTTGNAATLWSWVSAGEGDIVITDVIMPDENGLDLLPRIRKLRGDLPIIVMSAHNTLSTALKATERGAYDYLAKPFDLAELASVVKRALARPKQISDAGALDDAAAGDECRRPQCLRVHRAVSASDRSHWYAAIRHLPTAAGRGAAGTVVAVNKTENH